MFCMFLDGDLYYYLCKYIVCDNGFSRNCNYELACFFCRNFYGSIHGYTIIKYARNRIIIDEQEIFVPEQWGGKEEKWQFETHIKYTDIKDIFFLLSNNNSLNKPMQWKTR